MRESDAARLAGTTPSTATEFAYGRDARVRLGADSTAPPGSSKSTTGESRVIAVQGPEACPDPLGSHGRDLQYTSETERSVA